jgi:hypothetical protein
VKVKLEMGDAMRCPFWAKHINDTTCSMFIEDLVRLI